jgi:hypothetical protein
VQIASSEPFPQKIFLPPRGARNATFGARAAPLRDAEIARRAAAAIPAEITQWV